MTVSAVRRTTGSDGAAGTDEVIELSSAPGPGPRHGLTVSLELPRDRVSIPVVRHVVRYVLAEVGVVDDIVHDVELALSEACANVLDHAGAGDSYEISISIQTDVCQLRVVDRGHGFDYVSVQERKIGTDDERGRGLVLMHALMDGVQLESEPERGTLVTLMKRLAFGHDSPARTLMAEAVGVRPEDRQE